MKEFLVGYYIASIFAPYAYVLFYINYYYKTICV